MVRKAALVAITLCVLLSGFVVRPETVNASGTPDYTFTGAMSQAVLESYLSKAATIQNFVWFYTNPAQKNEWFRFISNTGTKFIHRSAFTWDDYSASGLGNLFYCIENMSAELHLQDPECILEACIFETTSSSVNTLPVPAYVFNEFGLPVESRNFSYSAMLYDDGRYLNHWGNGCSIPDITKTETQMLFYYLATRYINAGVETINFGQTKLMGELDSFYCNFNSLIKRIRNYAAVNARRQNVLINSHNYEIMDHCNPLWYSAKGNFVYETGNTQNYLSGDYSKLNRAYGSNTEDGNYIVYKLEGISSFSILTANADHYGDLPFAYNIYLSANGRDWTPTVYSSTEVFRYNANWPNYRMQNANPIPSGTKYLKIGWKALSAHWLAQLMNVEITGSTSVIQDSLDQPNLAVNKLTLDFFEYPMRMNGFAGAYPETRLQVNHIDSIYQKSPGGQNPQGFVCDTNPYLVEIDNYGGHNGNPGVNTDYWPWGYDEITWFSLQSSSFRGNWLNYAYRWIKAVDPSGNISMPAYRNYLKPDGTWGSYNAVQPGPVFPDAFGDEAVIKALFEQSGPGVVNLMSNGGFESGLNSWTAAQDFSVSNQEFYTGNYSLKLTGDWDNCKAYQILNVTPNTKYVLTFFAKCNAATDFDVYTPGWISIKNSHTFANNDWTMYTIEFVTGNDTNIIFAITDNQGTGVSYYDNFSMIKWQ